MSTAITHLSNIEIAERLARAMKAWRVAPAGASLTQVALAQRSGVGLTPLKRFEKTGAITLRNLVALLRGLNLLEGLDNLIPAADNPGPLALLAAEKKRAQRQRASRTRKAPIISPTP
jgi:hypothetical protein